jgi:hypothetical protein
MFGKLKDIFSGSKDPRNVCVVISHYNARPEDSLKALLEQIHSVPSGHPFSVRIVVNAAEPKQLSLESRGAEVIYRENTGFNIGAWEAGWRAEPKYDVYLFLQDECQIARKNWVRGFLEALTDGVGLVGERIPSHWAEPWAAIEKRFEGHTLPDHLVEGQPATRLECYRHFWRQKGIEPALTGRHLQSLVLCAPRSALERIGGLPVGANYGEAIASEIGISMKMLNAGLEIREVGPEPFWYISHPQWLGHVQKRKAQK